MAHRSPGVSPWAVRTFQNGNAYEEGFRPRLLLGADLGEIFGPAGAEAFRSDAPHARVELLDGGHFLLESHIDDVVDVILEWRATL